MTREAPCKTCEKRGCGAYHDHCAIYNEWNAKRAAERKAKAAEAVLDDIIKKHRHTAFPFWAKKARRRGNE